MDLCMSCKPLIHSTTSSLHEGKWNYLYLKCKMLDLSFLNLFPSFSKMLQKLDMKYIIQFLSFLVFKNVAEPWHEYFVQFLSLTGFSKMLQKLDVKIFWLIYLTIFFVRFLSLIWLLQKVDVEMLLNICHFLLFQKQCRNLT